MMTPGRRSVNGESPECARRRPCTALPRRGLGDTTAPGALPVRFLKCKAGQPMPRRSFTPQELQKIRALAAGWGKIIARQAFGDDGPGLDVDFAAMEQLATAAAQGLTEGTLSRLLEQHARRLGAQQPCPDCGRLCAV